MKLGKSIRIKCDNKLDVYKRIRPVNKKLLGWIPIDLYPKQTQVEYSRIDVFLNACVLIVTDDTVIFVQEIGLLVCA